MRKRFLSILIVAILCFYSLALLGCSNDGFELVRIIEYTTNGSTKQQSSRYQINYGSETSITKAEYESSPSNQRIYNGKSSSGILPSNYKIPSEAKNKTSYTIDAKKTSTDNLNRYYWSRNDIANVTRYIKCEEISTSYYYVYVKEVNNSTIIIRDTKGDTTYTVSSYRITRFD